YSVYIGTDLIYGHDPRTTGQTLFSLFPPEEISVNESGTLKAADAAKTGLGKTQDFPLLPEVGAGFFIFEDVPTDNWFDPPLASGFEYRMTGDSFFTDILELPTGLDADGLFSVSVAGNLLGNFREGQGVSFLDLIGAPVSEFTLAGIDPLVDSEQRDAFPLRLAFDTPTASFSMTPILADDVDPTPIPEKSSILSIALLALGLSSLARKQKVESTC
ncbi:MAG: hypothetical protein ABG776_19785, partial [Cyanobacteria bacterium J06555_13]